MELTIQALKRFEGGQAEVREPGKCELYIYCGGVKSIVVENNKLHIDFSWLAKIEKTSDSSRTWVNEDKRRRHTVDLAEVRAFYVLGSGDQNRLFLSWPLTGDLVILYPPNDGKLDPLKVKGLELPQQA